MNKYNYLLHEIHLWHLPYIGHVHHKPTAQGILKWLASRSLFNLLCDYVIHIPFTSGLSNKFIENYNKNKHRKMSNIRDTLVGNIIVYTQM